MRRNFLTLRALVAALPHYSSRHFEFLAVGEERDDAVAALQRGLAVHAAQYALAPGWYSVDDFTVSECRIGDCLRDGSPLRVQ